MNTPPSVVEKIEKALEESLAASEQSYQNTTDPALISSDPSALYQDYSVVGSFNPMTGNYQIPDVSMPMQVNARGSPVDKDARLMSHYFDYERYAAQMNAAKEDKKKSKQKQVKGSKKFWKARKEEKRRKKLIAEYKKD
jgi:hypothetical protein